MSKGVDTAISKRAYPRQTLGTARARIGAGMARISAALALADGGHHAHLIERTVSIGGAYPAIYKIFPAKGIHNKF